MQIFDIVIEPNGNLAIYNSYLREKGVSNVELYFIIPPRTAQALAAGLLEAAEKSLDGQTVEVPVIVPEEFERVSD